MKVEEIRDKIVTTWGGKTKIHSFEINLNYEIQQNS